jgi:GNAT superfamily N-acetyltransferase
MGQKQAALRKMFVAQKYRGHEYGTAKHLLDALITWAASRGLKQIYLGTTDQFLAAHRFYEKNGFSEMGRSELPAAFPVMAVDSKFYRREWGA